MIEKDTLTRFENRCKSNGINADRVLTAIDDMIEDLGNNTGLDLMIIIQRYYSEINYPSDTEVATLKHLSLLAESCRLEPVKSEVEVES